MDIGRIIQTCARMTPDEWRSLATSAAWHYRTDGGKPLPDRLLRITKQQSPTPEEWDAISRGVTKQRGVNRLNEVREQRQEARLKRREYMRVYMRGRRQGHVS